MQTDGDTGINEMKWMILNGCGFSRHVQKRRAWYCIQLVYLICLYRKLQVAFIRGAHCIVQHNYNIVLPVTKTMQF